MAVTRTNKEFQELFEALEIAYGYVAAQCNREATRPPYRISERTQKNADKVHAALKRN